MQIARIVAMDIESAHLIDNKDLDKRLGITCVGLWAVDDLSIEPPYPGHSFGDQHMGSVYYPGVGDLPPDDAMLAPEMSSTEIQAVLNRLLRYQESGYTVVAWNGLGFDLFQMAKEEGCRRLAQQVVGGAFFDPGYLMYLTLGFMIGLDTAARAFDLEGKKGMTGKEAPAAWRESRERQNEVLEYVLNDAKITAEVAVKLITEGGMKWRHRGRINRWRLADVKGECTDVLGAMAKTPVPSYQAKWLPSRSEMVDWLI